MELLASMFIFGTIGIFVRFIPLPSSVIALVRGVVGTSFLLLVIAGKKSRIDLPAVKKNLLCLCLSGVFLGANWILLFEAYRYTTVATATLCYYLAPVFVTLASPFVLKERLTPVKAGCIAIALIGMVLVSGVLEAHPSGNGGFLGVLFGICAAVLYACIVLLNKRLKSISAYDTTVIQLGISALVLLPYVLLTENLAACVPTPRAFVLLATVGILHTGMAYALYFGSIQSLRAQTVAIFSYVDPIVAILLSAWLLHEKMSFLSALGAVLVLGATLFSELSGTRKART